jgi:DNA-binding response OmpR family regulator
MVKNAKILIVEDRPDTRNMIRLALEKSGYVVMEAGDGDEALKKIKKNNLDLVILDILLPKKDGSDVLKEIRADKENKKLKIIMLTAIKTTKNIIAEYKKEGANGFLLKPIGIAEIRKEVAKQLKS